MRLDLPVFGLATFRLTKLIIDDEILHEPREALLDRIDSIDHPLARKAQYFLTCPWCISIWAAGGLALLIKVAPNIGELLLYVLAASSVSGVLASHT